MVPSSFNPRACRPSFDTRKIGNVGLRAVHTCSRVQTTNLHGGQQSHPKGPLFERPRSCPCLVRSYFELYANTSSLFWTELHCAAFCSRLTCLPYRLTVDPPERLLCSAQCPLVSSPGLTSTNGTRVPRHCTAVRQIGLARSRPSAFFDMKPSPTHFISALARKQPSTVQCSEVSLVPHTVKGLRY